MLFVLTALAIFLIFFAVLKMLLGNPIASVMLAVSTTILLFSTIWCHYLSKQTAKIKTLGEVLDIEQYQTRHSELFGEYIELCGLKLSELAFKYPIFLWTNPTKTNELIEKLITKARESKQQLLIFEDGDLFYKKHSQENDILLNPFIENAYTWNIYEDYKANDNLINYISKNMLLDCEEYLQAFKSCKLLQNSTEFLAALCRAPIDDVSSLLKEMKIDSQANTLIRKALEEILSFPTSRKEIAISNSNNIIWISCFQKNAMYKLSKFILETSNKSTLKIVFQRNSNNIKASNTIVVNPNLDEFYMRFDGTLLALESTNNNQAVANLFGQTTIANIVVGHTRYHNINRPAISEKDLANCESFFKYYKSYDILRF